MSIEEEDLTTLRASSSLREALLFTRDEEIQSTLFKLTHGDTDVSVEDTLLLIT